MLRLQKGRARLLTPSKTFMKGVEYKNADVPEILKKRYFEATESVDVVEAEPTIIEKIIPIFGAMTLEQLNGLGKAPLEILAMQYEVEIKGRPTIPELAQLVFDAQPEVEEDDE